MSTGRDQHPSLRLFEAVGIELEYMIVDRESLDVRPLCDRLFESAGGHCEGSVERGDIAWSNELALHVVELKTAHPAAKVDGLAPRFQSELIQIDQQLQELGARLMPTAMHPWMDPAKETTLWPHEQNEIYREFDRLFGCSGHGWSNLQSMHINLPFSGDAEFGRLHAAIRVVLPLLPALAASSPCVEGRATGRMDNRLDFYRRNARNIPSVTGRVIPEAEFTCADYRAKILDPIARDLREHGASEVLESEWVNARGAIARFVRDSIEIRVLDLQESPRQDLAIAAVVVALIRALVEERWCSFDQQAAWNTDDLEQIFSDCAEQGSRARFHEAEYLALFGAHAPGVRARELWSRLFADLPVHAEHAPGLEVIANHGSLSERISQRLGSAPTRGKLRNTYFELCEVLHGGNAFTSAG